jgi:hypothetical protein
VVCVVARGINGPLTSLVKQLDSKIAENGKLKSFVVVLTADEAKTASALETLAKDAPVKSVPLTLIADTTGPDVYQIAKDAEVTVMLWRGAKVEANHAFKAGELNEEGIKAILADLPKILK